MTKVAIITDTHHGARKGSKLFHDYFEQFYNDVFFPTLDKEGITTVIHMGDAFDSRKGVEFKTLKWSKRVMFDPLKERGIKMHLMVGNHDAYYKNTNDINAVDLLLKEYENITVYSSAKEVKVENLDILFLPWINEENREETLNLIKKTSCNCAMGHLELNGFRVNKQVVMDHGLDTSIFEKFKKVYSGHYHTRSDNGKIYYLGNPYEMFWNDVNDKRGFHLFETDTMEHTPVNNPYQLFKVIYFDDTDYQLFDTRPYENKIVKVVVKNKSNPTQFEKFIDKLYAAGVAELKIVENFNFTGWYDHDDEDLQTEDTFSILNRYIDEAEVSLDKSVIQKVIREVYQEACELV